MTEPQQDLDLVDVDQLPPQVRGLVRLIGLPETVRLLEARGGRPTYVPRDPNGATELGEILSQQALQQLSGTWPGETLDLPKPDKIATQIRTQYIIEARRRGLKSGRQLAQEFGLTYRWVKALCAQARDGRAENQADLFS